MADAEQDGCPHCAPREASDVVLKTSAWRVVVPRQPQPLAALWCIEPLQHLTDIAALTSAEHSGLQVIMRHAARLARSRHGASSVYFIAPEPDRGRHLHWLLTAIQEPALPDGTPVILTS